MTNILLIASLCFIWGATWVVIKVGLSESPPFYGAAFRFIVAVGILAVVVWHRRPSWPRGRTLWGWMIFCGVLMYGGSYAVVYYTEQYIDAALAAILFASFPFFVALMAHFYLPAERLNSLKVVGLIVGFAGVVVLSSHGAMELSASAWWAPWLMLVSPFASAAASVIVKKHLTKEDPFVLNLIQMSIGVLWLLPMAVFAEDISAFHWSAKSIGAVVSLGVFGSAFAFVTMYHLMRTMTASGLSLIAFVTPVVAAILGWIILDESLSWATATGAALVLVGIYIVNIFAVRGRTIPLEAAVEAIDCQDTERQ